MTPAESDHGTTPIRTLIVDDEPLAREGIRLLLASEAGFAIVGECGDGRAAIETIGREEPDLVFLDVQMPERDGLAVMREIAADRRPMVVFVTAHDEFAVAAFETHALDYLLKPIDEQRFRATVARIRERFREKKINELSSRLAALLDSAPLTEQPADRYIERFSIRTGDRIHFVDTRDLEWIEAADYYVRLHTREKTHLLRETLSALAEKLDPARFVRIHRSTIVSIACVSELKQESSGAYAAILNDGTGLRVSRSYRDNLNKILRGR